MFDRTMLHVIRNRPCRAHRATVTSSTWAAVTLVLAFLPGIAAGADGDQDANPAATAEAASGPSSPIDSARTTKQQIESLIRELGSPRYTARRAAAIELRRIGADAFDLLDAATDHADPEVAASAHYLLRQIAVRWVKSDDPAAVRQRLQNYGALSDEERLRRIQGLADLPNREGVAALCRVARFDRSPLLARVAAVAVIRPDLPEARRSPIDPELIERELGQTTRAMAAWLRQFQAQLRDPAAAVTHWQQLIDEESARLKRHTDETKAEILVGLLWNLADIHLQLGNHRELFDVVDQMIRLDSNDPERIAVALLLWLVEEKSWDAVDELLTKHRDRYSQSKRPMYMAALARKKQGKPAVAKELADQALQLAPQVPLERFRVARELELRDQYEWSAGEYHGAIDSQRVVSHEAILARVMLSNMLHDHEEYEAAADMLDPLAKELREDPKADKFYSQIRSYHRNRGDLILPGRGDERDEVAARLHFYRACQFHEEQDWQREREELDAALGFDKTDADVVIAMYRVSESDDKWRETTLQQISRLLRQFQKQIDADPDDPNPYNQWAWLVSNTEGDFQQAIRYSQKSLELLPAGAGSGAASYLDTLGRCYYAAGDYENAIKHQRQAVEKVGYVHVMQRQLELFEKALAEKQEADR